jgi:uncharacterized RDD family membrane protein YckC
MADQQPEPSPAPFGRRAFARLFDVFAVGVLAVPVLALTVQEDGPDDARFPVVVVVLYGLLPAVWEAWMVATRGTTPGKRLSGLVVRAGDSPPSFVAGFARSVLGWSAPALAILLLPWGVVLGVLAVVFGPAAVPQLRRDLPDLVSGTRVLFIGDVTDDVPEDVTDDVPGTDADER